MTNLPLSAEQDDHASLGNILRETNILVILGLEVEMQS
jgi:hypothetical protein